MGYGNLLSSKDAFNFDSRVFYPKDGENSPNHVFFIDLRQRNNPVGTMSWHNNEKDDKDKECNKENEYCIFEDS